eukprot:jgi/Botrbrau1/14882/Bobra.0248s0001.1
MSQALVGHSVGLEPRTGHFYIARHHFLDRRQQSEIAICPTNADCGGARQEDKQMETSINRKLQRRCSSADMETIISPWVIPFSHITLVREIGRGSLGKVYLGRWRETDVAVKMLEPLPDKKELQAGARTGVQAPPSATPALLHSSLEREAGILASLRHPNIVMFMGISFEPPCLVAEYCSRGSLSDLLGRARTTPAIAQQLTWFRRLTMALETAKGMLQLHQHEPPILHNDLKAANVLVDAGWHCKIADFNLSHMDGPAAVVCTNSAENPRWMAPEVIGGGKHSKASDMYAFGMILWELLTWETPWHDMKAPQIVVALLNRKERPEVPEDPSRLPGGTFVGMDKYIQHIQRAWAERPEDRPSFESSITELRSLLDQCKAARIADRQSQVAAQQPNAQEPRETGMQFQRPHAPVHPGVQGSPRELPMSFQGPQALVPSGAHGSPRDPAAYMEARPPCPVGWVASSFTQEQLRPHGGTRTAPAAVPLSRSASLHWRRSGLWGDSLYPGASPEGIGVLGTSLPRDHRFMPSGWYEPSVGPGPGAVPADWGDRAYAPGQLDLRDQRYGQVPRDCGDHLQSPSGRSGEWSVSLGPPSRLSHDWAQECFTLDGRQQLERRIRSWTAPHGRGSSSSSSFVLSQNSPQTSGTTPSAS